MNKYLRVMIFCILCSAVFLAGQELEFAEPAADELGMTAHPLNPDEGVMILLRKVTFNDSRADAYKEEYLRIKIFNEKGMNRATIEIPYFEQLPVIALKARTISKEGKITVVPKEKINDINIIKKKKFRMKAKSFTFPNVEPGCIVEYIYQVQRYPQALVELEVQDTIFTKKADFTIKSNKFLPMGVMSFNMTLAVQHTQEGNNVKVAVQDIPGFVQEAFSPPDEESKMRIVFFYTGKRYSSSDEFWKDYGKTIQNFSEEFMKKNKKLKEAITPLLQKATTPEEKIKALYEYVQGYKNLTYSSATGPKEIKTVDDLVKCKCGKEHELNMLFAAALRLAGLDSYVALSANRMNAKFNKDFANPDQLSDVIAAIKDGSGYRYFSPGTWGSSMKALSWYLYNMPVLVLTAEPIFSTMPTFDPATSISTEEDQLIIKEDGIRQIKKKITLSDVASADWRLTFMDAEDDQIKPEYDKILKAIEPGIIIDSFSVQNREDFKQPIIIETEYHYSEALPLDKLALPIPSTYSFEDRMFTTPTRKHPLCHEINGRKIYRIEVTAPSGMKLQQLPEKQNVTTPEFTYNLISETTDKGTVVITRTMDWNFDCVPPQRYVALRTFWNQLKQKDKVTLNFTK